MNIQANAKQEKTLQDIYAARGAEKMPDREILELLLGYAAPGCHTKALAQKLLECFGSFENIFSADFAQFCQLSELGESAAVLFSLIGSCPHRTRCDRNAEITHITCAEDAKKYFSNMLYDETIEKITIMCLDAEKKVLRCRIVSDGTVNLSEVSMQKAMCAITETKTAFAILAHNHPRGKAFPSAKDLKFTVKAREAFGKIGVKLTDHIIVGETETVSLNSIERFKKYFDK